MGGRSYVEVWGFCMIRERFYTQSAIFSWLFERRMSTVCGGMWIVDAANSYGHISNFLRLNVCLLVFFKGILCQLNFLGRPVWISRYFQFSTTFDGLRRGLALGSF